MPTFLIWRFVGIGALVLAIGGGFWYVQHLQDLAAQVPQLRAQVHSLENAAASQAAYDKKVQDSYERELTTLRDAALQPVSIRVCRHTVTVPAAARPAREPDGAAPAAGVLSEPASRDIGPAIDAEFRRCDEISAELRALQEWARGLMARGLL